jgi:3-hydroxyacyl-[acyl-carrier-protein] dehydratase
MRFLHFDRIVSIERGRSMHAVKCFSLADECLREHFPRRPVVPGTVWIEAMLQAIGWLVVESNDYRVLPVFTALEDLVVPADATPGRLVDLHAELLSTNPKASLGSAKALVEGREVASVGRVIYGHLPGDRERLRGMIAAYAERR